MPKKRVIGNGVRQGASFQLVTPPNPSFSCSLMRSNSNCSSHTCTSRVSATPRRPTVLHRVSQAVTTTPHPIPHPPPSRPDPAVRPVPGKQLRPAVLPLLPLPAGHELAGAAGVSLRAPHAGGLAAIRKHVARMGYHNIHYDALGVLALTRVDLVDFALYTTARARLPSCTTPQPRRLPSFSHR